MFVLITNCQIYSKNAFLWFKEIKYDLFISLLYYVTSLNPRRMSKTGKCLMNDFQGIVKTKNVPIIDNFRI